MNKLRERAAIQERAFNFESVQESTFIDNKLY